MVSSFALFYTAETYVNVMIHESPSDKRETRAILSNLETMAVLHETHEETQCQN